MTITTPIKPSYVTIEDETYGELTVRPFGATEELRLEELFDEASNAIEKANKIEAEAKENPDGIDEESIMKELKAMRKKSMAQKREAIAIFRRVITGDKADQLFEELPVMAIRKFINEALKTNG